MRIGTGGLRTANLEYFYLFSTFATIENRPPSGIYTICPKINIGDPAYL